MLQPQHGSPLPDAHHQYHLFNAAVCMGSLALQRPTDALAGLAISLVEAVIQLFAQVVHIRTSSVTKRNMLWLLQLREDINQSQLGLSGGGSQDVRTPSDHGEPLNRHLISLKTRLIERAPRPQMQSIAEQPPVPLPLSGDPDFQMLFTAPDQEQTEVAMGDSHGPALSVDDLVSSTST